VGRSAQSITELLAALSDQPNLLLEWEKQVELETRTELKTSLIEFRLGQSDMRLRLFKVLNQVGESIGWGRLLQDITQEKELDRVKSQLISVVSHELRTPLTIIKGNASTLLQTDVVWDAANQREFLEDILSESDRLSRLVSDLLDLSRLELGKSILHKQLCQVDELVQEVIQAEQRRTEHTIYFSRSGKVTAAEIDPKRIQVVIRNLLENAFKYAPVGTPVEVRFGPYISGADFVTHERNGSFLIEVEDRGPGILPGDRELIFDRFHRLDNGYSRMVGGVGLGLAICKAFVEAHGGRIWVEDGSGGVGSTFKFTVPYYK
jgi:signal transduction histidine kinase